MALPEGVRSAVINDGSFLAELARFIGTTVTVYTTSGGQSGFGVTGVLTFVSSTFISLITCIGPAPCCCLGSTCAGGRLGPGAAGSAAGRPGVGRPGVGRSGVGETIISNVGSVTDIPVDRIAAYVHNAV